MSSKRAIALLRGINVGSAKRVAMPQLQALVTDLGYGEVRTLLNSGNVVFRIPQPRPGQTPETPTEAGARIEAALAARLGIAARVIALRASELEAAIAANPLAGVATNPALLLLAVFGDEGAAARLDALAADSWGEERLARSGRFAYLWCPHGSLGGRLFVAFDKLARDVATTRNWRTVEKLAVLARED